MEDASIDCPDLSKAITTYSLGLVDTNINVNTLIEEVRKKSAIWDRRLPSHSNQFLVRLAWKSISDAMGVPAPILRKKWKNLRNQFAVEIAKPYPSKWTYFYSLIFLNGFVKARDRHNGKQDRPEERDPLAFSPNEEIKEEINDSLSNDEKFDPGKVKAVNIVTTAVTPVQSVHPIVTQPTNIWTSQAFNPTNFGVTPATVNVGSVSLPGEPMNAGSFNNVRFLTVGPGMTPQAINTQAFDATKFGVANVSLAQSMTTQTFNASKFGVVNVGTTQLPQMINMQAFDPTKFVALPVRASTSEPDQSVSPQTINSDKLGMVNVRPVSAQSMTTEAFDATKLGVVNVRPVSLPQYDSLPSTNTFSSIKVLSANSQIITPVPPILANGTEKKPSGAVATPTPHVQPVTAEIVDSEDTNIRTYPGQKKKPRLDMDDLVPKSKSSNEGNYYATRECEDLTTEHDPTEDENDENFFRSLLPHVRKIPMHLKLRFRNRIHELVEEFAYPELRKS